MDNVLIYQATMQSVTHSILQHTQEACATLLPLMETSSAAVTYTTSMQLGEYTFTITMHKKQLHTVLGKRRAEETEHPIPRRTFSTSDMVAEFEPRPHSDHVLYNNFGHNFSHTNPQPFVCESDIPYIT